MTKFYITTAIDYINDLPHLGHAYEKIAADVIARWHHLKGEDVFFLTGTDEHGLKVLRAAEKAKKDPQKFADEISRHFKNLCKELNISNDDFIRTTEKRHVKVAQLLFKKLWDNEDIYLGKYEGWYCVSCETFYLEKDLVNGNCPIHKKKVEKVEEGSYFFKMGEYKEKFLEHIKKNPDFIQPENRKNEIIKRLESEVKDLSISRTSFKWGVPVPVDDMHILYVWLDALTNYISALDYPNGEKFKKYWPADVHLIGKDILWHHTMIWGSILLAAGIELPKKIFVHGFISIKGEKLSKTRGIVVDPIRLVDKYGTDALRYFLIKEIPFGEDGDFSEEALKARINGELVADLGNLVNRTLTLVEKSRVKLEGKAELEKKLELKKIEGAMEKLELSNALEEIWNFVRACNKYVNDKQAWKLEGKQLSNVLYNLVEALRIIAILISSFTPETTTKINKQLGVKDGDLKDCKFKVFKGKIKKGKILFKKV